MSNTLSPIRAASGGRYFETHDGAPFLPIGANDSLSWPGLAPLYNREDVPAAARYLDELAASGINTLRLMLEYAEHGDRYFVTPVGTFHPPMVQFWDDLFALCEARGLRVMLTPWDTFWMGRNWVTHPYNVVNGGAARTIADMLTDETVIRATIRRLVFVSERWGGTGAFAAWDLFNEIDDAWGGSPQEQSAVISRFSHAVRAAERTKWGFTRPQTVSVYGEEHGDAYDDLIFRHPDLDFASTHVYKSGTVDFPDDAVRPALEFAQLVRRNVQKTASHRPYTDTEHGPIHLYNDHHRWLPEAEDDLMERRILWAHLAAGGAGGGFRWPYRQPHILTPQMCRDLGNLRRFTELLDFGNFVPHSAEADLRTSSLGEHVLVVKDAHQAVLFLLRERERSVSRPYPLRLCLFAPGIYRIVVWDIRRGTVFGESAVPVCADGTLETVLWTPGGDTGVAIRRVGNL